MNGSTLRLLRLSRSLAISSTLATILCLLVIPGLASGTSNEGVGADEQPLVQIRLDKRRTDVPPGVTLVVAGGGMMHNSFPALSADRSEIALLYRAGDPNLIGYPTFETYSTTTLELQERIELMPEIEVERGSSLRDQQLLMRIEGVLDDINARLSAGGYRSMETLFVLPLPRYDPLDGVERFGKRIDYPSNESSDSLTITSLATGKIELEIDMPRGVETYMTDPEELLCGWGGLPQQAWYDPELRVMVLRMIFSTSMHGCEQPEQWHLKRLSDR